MAEEISETETNKYDAFMRRFEQARMNVDELLTIPQLTCGQFSRDEVMETHNLGLNSAAVVKPTELDTFVFFRQFNEKFKKEIDEFNKLKQKYETNDMRVLRDHYLDENNYDQNHRARHFQGVWKDGED